MKTYTVGIAGLGAAGMRIARGLDRGEVPGMTLAAVSASTPESAAAKVAGLSTPPKAVVAEELAQHADIIIEGAPKAAFLPVATATIEAGKIFMPLSCAQLLEHMELADRAAETGAQIIVPTGAIIGLDAIRAMGVGEIHEVTLETRKPPRGLSGAPHLERNNISVEGLTEAKLVFKGTAREAAIGFPANVNVSAALSLAGVGPDRTMVEVWADPAVDRNHQSVRVRSNSAEAEMTIRNVPTEENPRTGKITALSVIACLQRMTAPLVAGT
ncbi:MAG: aspartate dehydrogenase [Pseudomonadota bacterium]